MVNRLDNMLRQASAALASGDFAAAERASRRILRRDARNLYALSWLGIALTSQGRAAEAAELFRRATQVEPRDPGVHLNLGNALMELGILDQAASSFARALELQPDYPEAHNSLGSLLAMRNDFREAVTHFRRALVLRPDYAEAYDNLGDALMHLRDVEEAVDCFRRAIALDPGNADFQCDLGRALVERQRWDEAFNVYRRAIASHPDHAGAHCNYAAALNELGRHREAIEHCERALALQPDFADAQYNRGLARLFLQEFETAWVDYERRMQVKAGWVLARGHAMLELYESLPHWQGPGERGAQDVAIWSEQGIGDQVLFSTLIPELVAAGLPVVYEVDQRLQRAYERAYPGVRFVALANPPHEELGWASRVLMAGSLPGLFRRSRDDFGRQPEKLLSALPDRVAHYRERLERRGPGLKIALSWKSTRQDFLGPRKSAALMAFAPLLTLPGVQFVDVQYGDTAAERATVEVAAGVQITRFEEVDHTDDLEALLAIVEACDLVITTSNATAHLAGAIGKRTWLLYPGNYAPFHYWARGQGDRSLWYPSIDIVSDSDIADWDSLIAQVLSLLRAVP